MKKKCAVIWCEDHRNLAYFKDDVGAPEASLAFGPGDLVEFEVREENDMRFALSPSVVAEQQYASLPDDLIGASVATERQQANETSLPGHERGTSHVVPFPELANRVA